MVLQLSQMIKLPEVFKFEVADVIQIPEVFKFEIQPSPQMVKVVVLLSFAIIFWVGFTAGKAWHKYQKPVLKLKQMPQQLFRSATGDKLHLNGCSSLGAGSTPYQMCKRCTKAYHLE